MAFSTIGTSEGSGLSSEINVTPLIDVLLVLLIIFMVIVPVVPTGLSSGLPRAAQPATTQETIDSPVLVQVEQGQTAVQYVIDGTGVERAEVGPRLRELLARRSVRHVLLRADARLDFGIVAGVIDAGQGAGAESVGLLTPETDLPSR